MSDILEFIKSVGIPAAIAFFVLWRVDARLHELVNEVRKLHEGFAALVAEQVAERVARRLDHLPH